MLELVVTCVIVDDSADFVEAARFLLEQQGMAVVGVASSGEEAVRRLRELDPDVVLVDLDLGGESGLAIAEQLDDRPDPPAVIIVSTDAEDDYRDLIKASPAIGFVPKQELSVRVIRELLERFG